MKKKNRDKNTYHFYCCKYHIDKFVILLWMVLTHCSFNSFCINPTFCPTSFSMCCLSFHKSSLNFCHNLYRKCSADIFELRTNIWILDLSFIHCLQTASKKSYKPLHYYIHLFFIISDTVLFDAICDVSTSHCIPKIKTRFSISM